MSSFSIAANQAAADSATFDSTAGEEAAASALHRVCLTIARGIAVLFFSLVALVEIILLIPFVARDARLETRAAWLHNWCRLACRVLGIDVDVRGDVPQQGLLVSNHLSYVDIIVFSAIKPCVFVAKSDVRRWPLFGWLAKSAGAIFVNRHKSADAAAAIEIIRAALDDGILVVLFPEGTSSDGSTVLPFKSALFQPAVELGSKLTAGAIEYDLPGGSVADEVCYWRDMTLVPHLLHLFSKPEINAKVALSGVKYRTRDRKIVAHQARERILQLRS